MSLLDNSPAAGGGQGAAVPRAAAPGGLGPHLPGAGGAAQAGQHGRSGCVGRHQQQSHPPEVAVSAVILLMLNVTKQNVVNSRDSVIHNIDELADSAGWQAAITRGDHKLIWGQVMMMIVMLRVMMLRVVMMIIILFQDYLLKRTQRNRSHSVQLYNVAADPSETHNIAAQFPNIVDSLKAEILAAKNKSFVEADYPKGEMCPAKI